MTRNTAIKALFAATGLAYVLKAQIIQLPPSGVPKPAPNPTGTVTNTNELVLLLSDGLGSPSEGITALKVTYKGDTVLIPAADLFAALQATK